MVEDEKEIDDQDQGSQNADEGEVLVKTEDDDT